MLVDKSFFIKGCDDFELGIKRKSKLEYRLSYDDEKELGAIVFINAGFGSVANISFMDFTRKTLAKKFPIIAINVFYHCFSNRFSDEEAYSANLMMDEVDFCRFKDIITQFGLDFNPQMPFKETMEQIEQIIIEQKKQNKLPKNMILSSLTASFYPPNGDYQNFGIMAAMDHIYALKHLYTLPEFCSVRTRGGGGSFPA